MLDVVLFNGALVMILSQAIFLAGWLRVKLKYWLITTAVLVVALFVLPPSWFSSAIVMAAAVAMILSHWFVLSQSSRGLLQVERQSHEQEAEQADKKQETGEITPFPAMNQPDKAPENDYEGVGQEEDATFDRGAHPTKKAGSKRKKKASKKKTHAPQTGTTADIPTADKPSIEEYLKPRDDFFNDD